MRLVRSALSDAGGEDGVLGGGARMSWLRASQTVLSLEILLSDFEILQGHARSFCGRVTSRRREG